MGRTFQKPAVWVMLALFCCALWGSAFPCVKIGYEWLNIETAGGQILFAGYRFFLAGVLTLIMGCCMERRILKMKKSSVPYIFRQGIMQTTCSMFAFISAWRIQPGQKAR